MFLNENFSDGDVVKKQYEPYRDILSTAEAPQSSLVSGQDDSQKISSHSIHSQEYDYPANFVESLDNAITRSRQEGKSGALLILSVNNLAMIIDSYGHDDGEKIMRHICEAVAIRAGANSTVERINRDQMGIILEGCSTLEIAQHASNINRLIQDYGTASSIGTLHVTCSIGSVDFPSAATSASDALDKAFIALRSTFGQAYCSYTDTRDDTMQLRQEMGLANYLRTAISDNRLRLAFQPIIETKTGGIAHYEALLRIISREGKISSAGSLIPIAERMGLIDLIDHIVFDMVFKELASSPNVTMAFNVSNITTSNTDWLNYVTGVLHRYPKIAERMTVEITETAGQNDLRSTSYFVSSLQAQGCKVALDDFGSGYTSFRQLKTLDVDIVKIDGAFIKDIAENADNRFFVKTLLDFTKAFGLTSVAEYVERGETAKILMEMGVDYLQGYFFGKPENYRSWVKDGEYRKD